MLFVADIGNTNINIGIFDVDRLSCVARLSSDHSKTGDQFALELKGISELKGFNICDVKGAVISSVVPEITSSFRSAVIELTGVEPLILGPGVKSGLHIKIDNPAQLGADLVAGAVGAIEKYKLPCLIIDLGTATKISVIDKNGAFLGCTISAGIGISLKALSGSASLLPAVELSAKDCPAFGTNTVASIQAGTILGTAAMIDGLCDRIEEKLGEKVNSVVATGGFADSIVKCCKRDIIKSPDLLLYGLRSIYLRNQ